MIKLLLTLLAMLLLNVILAQNTFRGIIKDSLTKEALVGVSATITKTNIGGISEQSGELMISNIPNGRQAIIISHVGYKPKEMTLYFPLADSSAVEILAFGRSRSIGRSSDSKHKK